MFVIAFDTETELIAPGTLAPKLVCLSWAVGDTAGVMYGGGVVHHSDLSQFETMLTAIEQSGATLVGHNVSYDMAVLMAAFPEAGVRIFKLYDAERITDTQTREQLIRIEKGGVPKGKLHLADLAEKYLGQAIEKEDTWRLRYSELIDTPLEDWPKEAIDYSRLDAETTLRVYQAQDDSRDEYRQARNAFALHLMSCRGIVTDQENVEALRAEILAEKSEAEGLLREAGIMVTVGKRKPKSKISVKRVQELVFAALGEKAPLTDKGAIKTGADVLEEIDDPALEALVRYKAAEKLESTWLEHLSKPIVQARYNVLVATGRTSCSKPNMQNPHRREGLRECFAPREGFVFAAIDYSTLELCTLAQVCLTKLGKSRMAQAINDGKDLHLALAAQMRGLAYEDAQARLATGDKEIKEARQIAKAGNFGFMGGMSGRSLASFAKGYGLELSVPFCDELKNQWLTAWPEMRDYFAMINHEDGEVFQLFSKRKRSGASFCAAANSYAQGLAADGAKHAVFNVARECYVGSLRGAYPVAFIHDEILVEVPEDKAGWYADEIARIMRETMRLWTPDITIKTESALMHRWSKAAEPTFNQEGELIPWNQ